MEIEKITQKYKEWYKKFLIKVSGLIIKFVSMILGYSVLSFIYLTIYDSIGFEKTLIILLIGVFFYGLRR